VQGIRLGSRTDLESEEHMKQIAVALCALSLSTQALSFMTGNELLKRMKAEAGSYHAGTAIGYVLGVMEAGQGWNHCLPADVTLKQVMDMTERTLIAVPEKRHLSADGYVTATLNKEFPCQKKGTPL